MKKRLPTCGTFSLHCIDSVALMYIQSISFGIRKLRFTPDKREIGFMSLLSLLDTKQTTNSSRRPTFPGSRASCLQHPGGMWECAALGLPFLFCVKYHSLVVHSSSPVNLFLVQPFTPLCSGRKMNMNYSGGLFCDRTRPRPTSQIWM